jgi:hypothetical protein
MIIFSIVIFDVYQRVITINDPFFLRSPAMLSNATTVLAQAALPPESRMVLVKWPEIIQSIDLPCGEGLDRQLPAILVDDWSKMVQNAPKMRSE